MIRVSRGKLWAACLAVCALVSTVAVRVVAAEPNAKAVGSAAPKKQAKSAVRVEKLAAGRLFVVAPDGKKVGVITPARLSGTARETTGVKSVEGFPLARVVSDQHQVKLKAEAEAKASGTRIPGSLAMPKADVPYSVSLIAKKRAEAKHR